MIINCTPHAVNFFTDERVITFEPCGLVPRLETMYERIGDIDGMPLERRITGEPTNMPEEVPDTRYIVSSMVASASNRTDLLVPDGFVRADDGRIIGCTKWIVSN